MRFVDEVIIQLASGAGGDGAVSFRRESYVPRGGPDGGDGGRGGDLVLEATTSRNTLVDFRPNKLYAAESGQNGQRKQMYGRDGQDLVLLVPVGTVVHDAETDEVLADLDVPGARYVLVGGGGGKGNIHFKSSTNRTPREFEPGGPAQERVVRLELKLIADVGLLGFPNAGKSTLITRVSNSRSRIGAHPFTTLAPELGVVRVADGQSFVVADIPGLVEGAADGVGLGHQFLRHVERCALYLHLVSVESWEESPVERYHALNAELEAYDPELLDRPQLVVLTKIDLVSPEEREQARRALAAASGREVVAISAVTGEGVADLVRVVWSTLSGAAL